jgi:single-strand DNA-binding protein
MNKVILSGNLTRDPEVRYTQSGMAYAKMGIAVNRPYTSKNTEGQATVDFFNLTAWGKTAEFCGRYLKKGSPVILEGRIQNDNYEDKNGVKHYSVSINVDNIEFSGKKGSGDGESSGTGGNYRNSGGGNYRNNSGSNYDNDTDDVDVPF